MSAIDDKKDEQTSNSKSNQAYMIKVGQYIRTVCIIILLIFGYFGISGIVLYLCKLAQANILPTDSNCKPYTNNETTYTEEYDNYEINIFPTHYNKYPLSMKVKFPRDDTKNAILDTIRNFTNKNFITNYFFNIITKLVLFTNSSVNTSMNVVNENFNETFIVLFGPIIYGILCTCILLGNQVYFMYLWFASMSWFFKKKQTDSNNNNTWKDISMLTSPIEWLTGLGFAILFVMAFIFGFAILPFLPFIIFLITMCGMIMYKLKLNSSNGMKYGTVFLIIKELFKEYKVTLTTIISICIVLTSFTHLDKMAGFICLGVVGLMYIGIVPIHLYSKSGDNFRAGFTQIASYTQAHKTSCEKTDKIDSSTKHGFIFNTLTSLLGRKQQGGGGKRLAKELTHIGKQLKRQ